MEYIKDIGHCIIHPKTFQDRGTRVVPAIFLARRIFHLLLRIKTSYIWGSCSAPTVMLYLSFLDVVYIFLRHSFFFLLLYNDVIIPSPSLTCCVSLLISSIDGTGFCFSFFFQCSFGEFLHLLKPIRSA